tara:strand:- start:1355 stop:1792 length:438 start_codon:yes stop_codon:yes gene_type:complete
MSGSIVSKKRVNRCSKIAIEILLQEKTKIEKVFSTFIHKKYKGAILRFDFDSAIDRLYNVKLTNENDEEHGSNDYEYIYISQNKLNDNKLVSTLLHESLHYLCQFRQNNKKNFRDINEEYEHTIMNYLGDTYEDEYQSESEYETE